jgi:hypothetical protein
MCFRMDKQHNGSGVPNEDMLYSVHRQIGPVYALVILGAGMLLCFLFGMGCSYCICMRRHVEYRGKVQE